MYCEGFGFFFAIYEPFLFAIKTEFFSPTPSTFFVENVFSFQIGYNSLQSNPHLFSQALFYQQ